MKIIYNFFKKLFSHDVICLLLLISALIFDVLFIHTEKFIPSLANIGRISKYGTMDLEFVWRILTGAAILFNIYRLYVRTGFERSIIGKIFSGLLAGNAVIGGAVCYFAYKLMFSAEYADNYALYSKIFILASLGLFLIGFIATSFKSVKYAVVTLIYILALGVHYYNTVYVSGADIFTNLPFLTTFIMTFFINFTEFFKIKPKERRINEIEAQ
ncbi:MAG: hypothetical protein LBT30_06140 [Clostridiales bacterium]|jgi:hypothetical protein|nr:hypothetical protein [Clostridiales bacterium]